MIVSEQTVRALIEAHASMAEAYHRLNTALHRAAIVAPLPQTEQLGEYIKLFAAEFPELAAVAERIESPQPYTPRPAIALSPPRPHAVPDKQKKEPGEPANMATATPLSSPSTSSPPPLVNPNQVKYEDG